MKWLSRSGLLIGAVIALCALSRPIHAATSANMDITVSIAGTKSVLLIGATTYDFGALAVNTSSVSVSSFTIQNNSPVFIETFTVTGANAISNTGGTNWTLAASTGANQYALAAQFSDSRPADTTAAWTGDDLTTSAITCSAGTLGNGTEAESGANVGINQSRGLWFRLRTPSSVTDASKHTVTITVSVQ